MPRTGVIPAPAKLPEEDESQRRQASHSPCTPPPQPVDASDTPEADDGQAGQRRNRLEWSPQTPESIPVLTVKEIVAMAAAPMELSNESDGIATAPGTRPHQDSVDAPLQHQEDMESPDTSPHGTAASAACAAPPLPYVAHVDPCSEVASSCRGRGGAHSPSAAGPSLTSSDAADVVCSSGVFFPQETSATVSTALFVLVSSFCDLPSVVQLMRVSRDGHRLATSDAVWRPILTIMNLPPLLATYERRADLYRFFVDDIITTRALHGHYTFQAANDASGSRGSVSDASGSRTTTNSAARDHIRDDDSLQEDVFNIASLQLLISAASLGQSNHLIGRVQLLLTYKNDSMEVLQGSCRFSSIRRCFSLCCSAFGTVKRGPVFTVAVATVTKPWANEGFQHFSEHKNGIRLVMTPVLWEGQSPGSQITEKDILVVSRPRPALAAAAEGEMADASLSMPSTRSSN